MDRSVVFTPREPVLPGGIFCNCVCLLAVSASLLLLLYHQWVLQVPPCPMCQLQRMGIILTGIGFMRNLRFGVKSAHYGVALTGALLTGLIALRQISLEAMPGQTPHGPLFEGMHFYTWTALFSLTAIIVIAALLGVKSAEYPAMLLLLQSAEHQSAERRIPWARIMVSAIFFMTVSAHMASSMAGCDRIACTEDLIDRLQLNWSQHQPR
ncbi:disulfide bond formation protein B [Herbaspirillum sp. DW155]|uniref:disulfide bond formation protein B n=1 Tax=Herbaspirillum sp. DW155 TaxID=3095609 RepID=UPI00308E8271|nr:disulfide bond formation protein B [Herbaspirillum sp. DW155]